MHWITNALCAEVGPTLFYAEPNDNMMTTAAKQVCNVCPVIDTCAEHGIKHEVHGVWGLGWRPSLLNRHLRTA